MSRLRAETMPAVTVEPMPKGSPIAITQSPMRALSLSPKWVAGSGFFRIDLQQGQVGLDVAADHLGRQLGAVLQGHRDLVGILDHMIVGDDVSRRIDHKAGAQRSDMPRRIGFGTQEILEQIRQGRSRREVRHLLGRRLEGLGSGNIHHCGQQPGRQVGEGIGGAARRGVAAKGGQPAQDNCKTEQGTAQDKAFDNRGIARQAYRSHRGENRATTYIPLVSCGGRSMSGAKNRPKPRHDP